MSTSIDQASSRNQRKKKTGVVVKSKMDKSVVVVVKKPKASHPIYGKAVLQTTKLMAHDPDNACQVGDRVTIMETRPLSRRKNWLVINRVQQIVK